jgi:hypothetical protein
MKISLFEKSEKVFAKFFRQTRKILDFRKKNFIAKDTEWGEIRGIFLKQKISFTPQRVFVNNLSFPLGDQGFSSFQFFVLLITCQ